MPADCKSKPDFCGNSPQKSGPNAGGTPEPGKKSKRKPAISVRAASNSVWIFQGARHKQESRYGIQAGGREGGSGP